MPVKFLKRVNANEQEVQGGQKIPRLQGAANIPVDTYTCQRYSSNWPKKSKIDFVQKRGNIDGLIYFTENGARVIFNFVRKIYPHPIYLFVESLG